MRITTIILSDNHSIAEIDRAIESAQKSDRIAVVVSPQNYDDTSLHIGALPQTPQIHVVNNKYGLDPYRNMINLFGRYWKETEVYNIIHCPNFDHEDKLRKSIHIFHKNSKIDLIYTDAKLKNNSTKYYSINPNISFNSNFLFKKREGINFEPGNPENAFLELAQKLNTYHIAEPLMFEQ